MAGPACVACGSDARPSSRVAYERILSPYSISAEPPPLRPGVGQRHGVSSRNGGARRGRARPFRQHAAAPRRSARRLGLDMDRPLWGIYELCERYRTGDLPPDVIFVTGARLLFVGATGAIVGALLNDRFAWTVAFGLGVLPM